jgi:myosin heavy subunit
MVKQGKVEDALKEFSDAINTIPEVAASYAYFVGRDREAEAARQARLKDALDKAEAAINTGSYPAAAVSYRAALTYLPVSSERLDKAVANLQSVGVVVGSQAASQTQSRVAGNILAQADASRTQGRYEAALTDYVNLLAQYPLATQSKDALKGIQASVKGLNDAAETTLKEQQQSLGNQIASLQQELTARRADVLNLQGTVTKQKDDSGKLLTQIDGLNTQLKQVSALAAKGQVSEQQRKALQDKFDAMQKSYKDYTAQEDPVLKAKGDTGLMDTKPYFDAFFRSAAIQETFPGLPERVKRYDQGFQTAGRSDAINDATTIVVNFSKQATPALKRKYVQEQLKVYAKDPDMTQLLQEMDQRLAAR